MDIIAVLSQELSVPKTQIESAVKLMDEGNTIPFIARYRKEVTGGLDDTILRNLEERLHYLRNLEKRKQEVLELLLPAASWMINRWNRCRKRWKKQRCFLK